MLEEDEDDIFRINDSPEPAVVPGTKYNLSYTDRCK